MEYGQSGVESGVISAHSERQAMDWSLVLASQDIPTAIERSAENRWALIVNPADRDRALEAIHQFRLENRGWVWRQQLPWSGLTFHWGGLFWCLLLVAIYRISVIDFPGIQSAWVFSSEEVRAGEWWRLFTAVLLHGDLAHLFFNVTTGFVLFGLAMARFGPGCALLASYLAGVAGYLAGLEIYRGPYHGLGASGMVMGALGLITMQTLPRWRRGRAGFRYFARGALAGILLFVLLGTSPKSDVVAHVGGFVAGGVIGGLLLLLPDRVLQSNALARISWLLFVTLVALTGGLAILSAMR